MSFGSHSLVDWFIRSHILYIYEYNNTFVKFDFMASIFDLFLGWSFVSAAAYIACTWLSCGTGKYLGYVHFQSFLKREMPSTDNYVCKSVRPIWRLALWRLLLLDWLGFYECLFALLPRLFFDPKNPNWERHSYCLHVTALFAWYILGFPYSFALSLVIFLSKKP